MNDSTGIAWTDATWNPVTGCTAVSAGCANCYAAKLAATRLKTQERYKGLAVLQENGHARWTGAVKLHADRLNEPLVKATGRKIFVCNMSDLFHESVPYEFIDRVFARMALQSGDVFQILTKRSARALAYMTDETTKSRVALALGDMLDGPWIWLAGNKRWRPVIEDRICDFMEVDDETKGYSWDELAWPPRNVWFGVSVEDQDTLVSRGRDLLHTPAALRYLSVEPLLGPLDFYGLAWPDCTCKGDYAPCEVCNASGPLPAGFDWAILGGESGDCARNTNVDWITAAVSQLDELGVSVFVKQLGSWPHQGWDVRKGEPKRYLQKPGVRNWPFMNLKHKKGEDPNEWPTHLQRQTVPRAIQRPTK